MELSNFMQEFLPSLPSEKWLAGISLYQFNGFWFRPPHLYGVQKALSDFKPLSTDVFLACHPKTGTTWLKSLLFAIIYRSNKKNLELKISHDLVPNLELRLYSPFAVTRDNPNINDSQPSLTGPRKIFSTHLPFQIIGDTLNSSACKIVYVTREPKDTLISFWHFINRTVKCEQGKPWSLEIAVDQFCKGTLPFGPYYDHVLGYRKESLERLEKVLFMTYEELKDDPKTHARRLAKFLGCPFEDDENGEEELEDIVRSCSFDTLSNLEVNKSSELKVHNIFPHNAFFRTGQVGDHLNFLKPEMIQRIDEITNEKFGAEVNFIV